MQVICELSYQIKLTSITFCKYSLSVSGKQMELSFPQLLQLRQSLLHLTSPSSLCQLIDNDNFVLLFVADKQHLLFLEIPQLLDLKDEVSIFFEDFKSVSF